MAKSTTRPIVRIYTTADEFIDREMNDAEFAKLQADQAAEELENTAAAQKAADRAALLAQLGITEEQAKLLLG